MKLAWLLLIASTALPMAWAQGGIYRCERAGVVSFTNIEAEAKGCKRVVVTPKSSHKTPDLQDKIAEKTFPRIDNDTQRKRDESRDELIRKELNEQKQALDLIVERLSHFEIKESEDQQKQIDRFKTLNEERRIRAKSIAELEKQLGIGKATPSDPIAEISKVPKKNQTP